MAAQFIRIVATPPGEAPLWVREKWVGLCLPLAGGQIRREAYVSGVLSGPRNRFVALAWRFLGRLDRQSGYAVYAGDALTELEKNAPDAAAWWRENASRSVAPGRKFLFRAPCCKLVPKASAAPPLAKAPPAPQGQMRPAAARIALHRSPIAPALILALVLFGGFWNWSHPVRPERQAKVHGDLLDWSLHRSSRGQSQTVHMRIAGRPEQFRIDPAIFRDLMRDRLPAGFVKGAAIDVTVDAAQLAQPIHPLLEPGVAMVWVNGLVVNGVTAFSLKDVLQHEKAEWTGWFALAAAAAAYLAFTIKSGRRRRVGA